MKKTIALILAVLLALSALAACSLLPKLPDNTDAATVIPNESYDRDAAVVTVGDETVTMGDYIDMFDSYASYYSAYGYNVAESTESLNEFQDFIIDILAEEKIIAYQARQSGLTALTDAQLKEVEAAAAGEIAAFAEGYREQAQSEAAQDSSVDVEARIKELVAAESEYYTGKTMSYDEFEQWILENFIKSEIGELFREMVLQDVTVTDDALAAWYADALEQDTQAYTESGGAYKDNEEAFELYGGTPVTYVPEGYSRVLHILVLPQDDPSAEYDEKVTSMEALQSEYKELSFDAAVNGANDARLSEILKEYKALQAEVETLENARFTSARTKADDAYAKLKAGNDFAAIMKEYTEDNAMIDNETISKKGLLISNSYESETDWSPEVKTAFAALKPGAYSAVVQDSEGCHILYYLGDEPAGAVPMAGIAAGIRELLLGDLQQTEWASMLETWRNDGSVTINQDLVRSYNYNAVG
ncbi:MAG: peptidyl-prolyl cis-trans isomerase [Christensenellaceae bacterium]|jgi:parvulin-like peptidyl-prolyl isomerase|nr:peptidyl-prolyl cis-trans isomerase [Christensenellaceae bacterium]